MPMTTLVSVSLVFGLCLERLGWSRSRSHCLLFLLTFLNPEHNRACGVKTSDVVEKETVLLLTRSPAKAKNDRASTGTVDFSDTFLLIIKSLKFISYSAAKGTNCHLR